MSQKTNELGSISARQALSSAKERLGDKMGRADPCTSLLAEGWKGGGDPQTLTASCTEGHPSDLAQALGERASDPVILTVEKAATSRGC